MNIGPQICKVCGRLEKPLFTSFFCDHEDPPKKCKHGRIMPKEGMLLTCEDCLEERQDSIQDLYLNYSPHLDLSASIPLSRRYGPVNPFTGTAATHWIECEHCGNEAVYCAREPFTGEKILLGNNFFQSRRKDTNGNRILCDSCDKPVSYATFLSHNLRKY